MMRRTTLIASRWITVTIVLVAMLAAATTARAQVSAQGAAPGSAGGTAALPSSPADIVRNTNNQYHGGFWMPADYSTDAPKVDFVFDVITWICVFFFVLICAIMVYFMFKYRRKSVYDKATSDVTHNTPLELTWTIIPLALVIAIFYVGMEGYLNLRNAPLGAYEVKVTAQRWSWAFKHPNGCVDANVLRVPVGRPVKLMMESTDVLHALFIPAFRVKQDIVPGRITTLWFEATAEGDFDLFCAEYCGKDHSQMKATVFARNQDQFQADLLACADWPKDYDKSVHYIIAGEKIYPRCASCHTLDGKASTGPTWKGLWHEIETGAVVFTDGSSLKDLTGPGKMFLSGEDYIKQSILNPQQKIVMNFTGAMSTFQGQLKPEEIDAIIDFIKKVDGGEFDEKGKLRDLTKYPKMKARDQSTEKPAEQPKT